MQLKRQSPSNSQDSRSGVSSWRIFIAYYENYESINSTGTIGSTTEWSSADFNQMIQPETLTSFYIFHHQIGKSLHMARCLQYWFRCQNGAIDLQHLFLQYKEISPGVYQVCFQ
ncbi:hypothetical protein ALC62_05421 [Cyphomyrmex costatus]|uniref:Uncharacterized protein n=1 Tax=Cyphomyrmex costatus TaxID=456900 RepID=A0A195CSV7_9HYME|nr:hypothetical protein ALC62_05421 [Cyphomyrmex costatus]